MATPSAFPFLAPMMRYAVIGFLATLFALSAVAINGHRANGEAPAAAQAAGYRTKTFETVRFDTKSVDTRTTRATGFQWYMWNFFAGSKATGSAQGITLNADRTISIDSPTGIASTARTSDAPGFRGTGFGGGGYFEAEIALDPRGKPVAGGGQWPAWWMMSTEHMVELSGATQWPGAASGYEHFAEIDAFEYNRFGKDWRALPNYYGATVHDWSGRYNQQCHPHFCDRQPAYQASMAQAPIATDWRKWHRVGALWVPASDGTKGRISFYFDDTQVTSFDYDGTGNAQPVETDKSLRAFGNIDRQHMTLILNGARGWPLRVRSVRVWQKDARSNWVG